MLFQGQYLPGHHWHNYLNSKHWKSNFGTQYSMYDDIPSKLAQIYPNTSSIIQHPTAVTKGAIKRLNRSSETVLLILNQNPAPTHSF
jgi:hypothetical protein